MALALQKLKGRFLYVQIIHQIKISSPYLLLIKFGHRRLPKKGNEPLTGKTIRW